VLQLKQQQLLYFLLPTTCEINNLLSDENKMILQLEEDTTSPTQYELYL